MLEISVKAMKPPALRPLLPPPAIRRRHRQQNFLLTSSSSTSASASASALPSYAFSTSTQSFSVPYPTYSPAAHYPSYFPAVRRPALSETHRTKTSKKTLRSCDYATQTPGSLTLQVFSSATKHRQRERSASNPEASRRVDYLRDEVATRLCERLLVHLLNSCRSIFSVLQLVLTRLHRPRSWGI